MLGFHASGIGGARRSQSVASLTSRHTAPCKVIGCAVCRAAETACMETQLKAAPRTAFAKTAARPGQRQNSNRRAHGSEGGSQGKKRLPQHVTNYQDERILMTD